jgi:hypothetical protein
MRRGVVMRGLQHIHAQWNAWKPGELGRSTAFREGPQRARHAGAAGDDPLARRGSSASAGLFNPGIGGAGAGLGLP